LLNNLSPYSQAIRVFSVLKMAHKQKACLVGLDGKTESHFSQIQYVITDKMGTLSEYAVADRLTETFLSSGLNQNN
jgi:hypothetical protein